jgi:hypothetical protein
MSLFQKSVIFERGFEEKPATKFYFTMLYGVACFSSLTLGLEFQKSLIFEIPSNMCIYSPLVITFGEYVHRF